MKTPKDTKRTFGLNEITLMAEERKQPRPRRLSQLLCAAVVFAAATFVGESFSQAPTTPMVMSFKLIDRATEKVVDSGIKVAKDEHDCFELSLLEMHRFHKMPNRALLRLETSCDYSPTKGV